VTAAVAGIVTVLLGLVLAGLAALTHGSQEHSYGGSSVPPQYSSVTQGKEYFLSVPGGIRALSDLGQDPQVMACEYLTPDGQRSSLEFTPEPGDSKATNAFGRFVAPVGGPIGVDCPGYGAVFLDGADDASADWSGAALLGAVVLLTIGLGLTLSTVRGPRVDHIAGV